MESVWKIDGKSQADDASRRCAYQVDFLNIQTVHDRRDVCCQTRQSEFTAGGGISTSVTGHVESEHPVLAGQRWHPSPPPVEVSARGMVQQDNAFLLPRVGKVLPMVVELAAI